MLAVKHLHFVMKICAFMREWQSLLRRHNTCARVCIFSYGNAVLPHFILHFFLGTYKCIISDISNTLRMYFPIIEPPKISGSSSPDEQLVAVDSVLELECIATGLPPPTLSWLKDGRPLQDSIAVIEREGQLLRINKVQVLRIWCLFK